MPQRPEQKESIIIEKSLKEAKQLALDSLIVNGFELQEETDNYIQGKRPNKIGFFVGSGGETIGIWLESISEDKTSVLIKNKKSFVGYVGQQNWEREIRKEMLGVNE
ncbi:MAG: hypothetical protein H6755_05555 [Candidatus Omnitrophica bacterium]|nr:hypothetical protein [Candidatus Omnitrophota bacterium]